MKTYTLQLSSGRITIARRVGKQTPGPLMECGSYLPEKSPFRFRGSDLEHAALTVLTDHFHANPAVVLRGKTKAWRLHRAFCTDVVSRFMRTEARYLVITTPEIDRWVKAREVINGQGKLFESEEQCRRSA